MNGLGYSYAVFAQDDWKITPSLTLNFGLRYEIHPPLKDTAYNTADFLPNWKGTVNGQAVTGAVVVPNAKGLSWTIPAFAESIAPTPILTAAQAGIPDKLRYTDKSDCGPRWLWTLHRSAARVLPGFRLGSSREQRALLLPELRQQRKCGPDISFSISGESECFRLTYVLLRVSHPLPRSVGATMEFDI